MYRHNYKYKKRLRKRRKRFVTEKNMDTLIHMFTTNVEVNSPILVMESNISTMGAKTRNVIKNIQHIELKSL
jgi:hypothetical protein